MFILSQKLKLLKGKLKAWNKDGFGNVHDMLNKAFANLRAVLSQIQLEGQNDDLFAKEKKAQLDLETALSWKNCFGKRNQNSDDIMKETGTLLSSIGFPKLETALKLYLLSVMRRTSSLTLRKFPTFLLVTLRTCSTLTTIALKMVWWRRWFLS
ncbi:unnamed protein product [Lathyrus sativus]|nr:unnamed protein product [Lathyrus sativus]